LKKKNLFSSLLTNELLSGNKLPFLHLWCLVNININYLEEKNSFFFTSA
jgi:hypothetical protein